MEGKRFLQKIKLQNLLSFGSEGVELELQPLNVLIGPNGSGKSNLIEALSVLAAAPRDLAAPFREGGGVTEWIWKGEKRFPGAILETVIDYPQGSFPLIYRLGLGASAFRLEVIEEALGDASELLAVGIPWKYYIYLPPKKPFLAVRTSKEPGWGKREISFEDIIPGQSILSQRKDADSYPELTFLGQQLGQIAFFREWTLGRSTPPRSQPRADSLGDFLVENASNLALVLNDLQNRPAIWKQVIEKLRLFYEWIEDVTVKIDFGGTVQVRFHERGFDSPIPATRLSDGTLRYLSLLAILLHPDPPPLICLEEPELGLHPDAVRAVGDLLMEASQRTQLIVTTHSTSLVSALTEVPEAIVVCERGLDGTTLRRLEPEKLEEWLEHYSLGDLWSMGQLGGTR